MRKGVTLGLAVMSIALIAGCGADRSKRGGTVTVTGPAVEVRADEYYFDPQVINTQPGDLKITVRDIGTLAHNMRIFRDDRQVGHAAPVEPGETTSTTVKLTPGRYEMICTIGDHDKLGVRGEIIVK